MSIGRLRSLVSALVLSAASVGVSPAAPAAAATTFQYPSVACPTDGDHGLQDCIDAAAAGDTIVLVSEINPDGPIIIKKSLTLKGSSRSHEPRLPFIAIGADDEPVAITVQDVRVSGRVLANMPATPGGHTVTLRRISVRGDDAEGVRFATQGPASFTLEQSVVNDRDDSHADALSLFAEDPDGLVTMRVVGNRISMRGNPTSDSGIGLTAVGDGTLKATIHNNTVWDVARCLCGNASGIALSVSDAIRADVDVVGNTVDRSATSGLSARNQLDGDGRFTLDVFNNVFSHMSHYAMRIDGAGPSPIRFRAGYNARYKVALGNLLAGRSAGPGNLRVNPRYVDRARGDLRLRADSPLIDKGVVCSSGGVSIRDAAGNHRLKGRSVDIGAYERGAGSASGLAKVGTSGNDTLVGGSGRDILCGFGGNDRLCARDGKGGDYVHGGSGRDRAATDRADTRRSIEATTTCVT